jgi:hypothetical protein
MPIATFASVYLEESRLCIVATSVSCGPHINSKAKPSDNNSWRSSRDPCLAYVAEGERKWWAMFGFANYGFVAAKSRLPRCITQYDGAGIFSVEESVFPRVKLGCRASIALLLRGTRWLLVGRPGTAIFSS